MLDSGRGERLVQSLGLFSVKELSFCPPATYTVAVIRSASRWGLVGDQTAAVERTRGRHPLGNPACHDQRRSPAHAIPTHPEAVAPHLGPPGEEVEEGGGVGSHRIGRHRFDHPEQACAFGLIAEHRPMSNGAHSPLR